MNWWVLTAPLLISSALGPLVGTAIGKKQNYSRDMNKRGQKHFECGQEVYKQLGSQPHLYRYELSHLLPERRAQTSSRLSEQKSFCSKSGFQL